MIRRRSVRNSIGPITVAWVPQLGTYCSISSRQLSRMRNWEPPAGTYQEVYGTPTRFPVLNLGTEEKTSLAPLVETGRESLACSDVAGVAKVELQEVQIEHFGCPYQIIRRQSDDLLRLVEEGAFRWPHLRSLTSAIFQVHLDGAKKASRVRICAPGFGYRGSVQIERAEESAVIRQFLAKRCFLEA